MIIKEGTKLGNRCLVINKQTGGIYSKIKKFNTKTKEAIIYVYVEEVQINTNELSARIFNAWKPTFPLQSKRPAMYDKNKKCGKVLDGANNEPVTVKITLPHAIAIDKETLIEII